MSDDEAMDTSTHSTESSETRTPPPRPPLVRPVEGRTIAGVAAGIADSLGMSRGIVRFGFVVLILFAGLGLGLYAAGWLLIRDETEDRPLAQRFIDSIRVGPPWFGVAVLCLAIVVILGKVTFLSDSLLWATALIVAGVLIYRGDLGGGRAPAPPVDADIADSGSGSDISGAHSSGIAPPPPPQPYVPAAPAPPPPPPPPPSILGRLTIGVGLLALGVLAIVDNLTTVIDPQPRHYLAVATVVLGLGLITGGFVGRARWLILLGFFVIPPLVVSPAAEVDWDGDFSRRVSPTDLSTLAPSYETAAGSLIFDLASADWDGATVDLNVDVAAGKIEILIPGDVGVTGNATVSIGEIQAPDGRRSGMGNVERTFDIPGEGGTLNVDLEVGAGAIEIATAGIEGDLDGGHITPLSVSDLEPIDRNLGDLTVDLGQLELTEDTLWSVRVEIGNLEVLVPDSLNVQVDANAGAGTTAAFGSTQSGFGSGIEAGRIVGDGPVLTLDLSTGTGNITVTER